MQEIINDIKDKLNFSFTVIILLILFIEKFLKIHRPEQAEMATLSYFIIIPLYIFLYLAFYSRKNKLKIRKIIRYINNLLSINLLSIAILIMIIANIGNIDKIANWLKQCSPML